MKLNKTKKLNLLKIVTGAKQGGGSSLNVLLEAPKHC